MEDLEKSIQEQMRPYLEKQAEEYYLYMKKIAEERGYA